MKAQRLAADLAERVGLRPYEYVLVANVKMGGIDGTAYAQEALKIWPWLGVILLTVLLLAIAFFQAFQGLFSAMILLILTILGSAIAHFHIGDGLYNIAFTGDFNYSKSRLFSPAVSQFPRLEAIFMESTYGGSNDVQPPRREAEVKLYEVVTTVLNRGGKILIPAFAVGRSQEVMLALEEGMRLGRIPKVSVYLDGMIREATAIHTTYPEYLNSELRNQIFHDGANPFLAPCFVQVDSPDKREKVITGDPCVFITTSGMLNGGPVMEYLKGLSPDPRNALVFVGYQAEGTIGRRIQKGWREVPLGGRETIAISLEIFTVDGFSGHSDRRELVNYVAHLQPKPEKIFTIHGDENKTIDLAVSLHKRFHIETRSPMNLETYRLV
jgi:predicted metal-dependent RNase